MRSLALSCLAVLGFFPAAALAQVDDLSLSKTNEDVVVSWAPNGNGPYRVFRTRNPDFTTGNRLVGEDLSSGPASDTAALQTSETYFYVVLDSTVDNPWTWDLNPPTPVPTISQLTLNQGQPGDVVTVDGTNFPESGSGLTVYFGKLGADILTVDPTQLTVQVPAEAVTADVIACVASEVCSNGVRFTVTVGGTFLNISSLAFEEATGSLWVADRSTADTVYEVDAAGNRNSRGGIAEPFISNVSPGDGSGRVYLSNGTNSTLNQGTIKYISSADNSVVTHRNAGVATTDPVWARGMAANDSWANVAFFLDGNLGRVRRVPQFGGIDYNWGETTFTFNNPAGARFDSAGNLYVSSTTSIYKITSGQATSLVAGGFTGAAGLDLSEDTGIPTLLVADKAAGKVLLVDGENGNKTVVGEGFSSPVAAVFSEVPATGTLYYDVAEPTRVIRLDDPKVKFDPSSRDKPVKVLIHKWRATDTYPNGKQTEDRKIRIDATVVPNPGANTHVYFNLVDPKDGNPYASTGAGDNKHPIDTTPGIGIFPLDALTDDAGVASTTLTITDTYGGDNYQVEASLEQPFKRCAKSAVYTAWKRVYVEYDRMYKEGEFLTQTSGAATTNTTWVYVPNPGTFPIDGEVHLLSGSGDFGGGDVVSPAHMDGELRTVVDNTAPDHVVLNQALNLTYRQPEPGWNGAPFSFLARAGADAYYDTAPTESTLAIAFDDAHVDWVFIGDGNSFIPAWPNVNDQPGSIAARSIWFFRGFDWAAAQPETNLIQLVAAKYFEADPGPYPYKGLSDRGLNWSWVFTGAIAGGCSGCTPTQVANFAKYVFVHEAAHQWDVNGGSPGHCLEHAWNDPSRWCLMNDTNIDPKLGVAKFHSRLTGEPAPPFDLYCIRGHEDDLNQSTCSWPASSAAAEGSDEQGLSW